MPILKELTQENDSTKEHLYALSSANYQNRCYKVYTPGFLGFIYGKYS